MAEPKAFEYRGVARMSSKDDSLWLDDAHAYLDEIVAQLLGAEWAGGWKWSEMVRLRIEAEVLPYEWPSDQQADATAAGGTDE
jgi:hypothetical protein